MNDDKIAIRISDIHKEFTLPQYKNTSFKQAAVNIVRKNNKVTQKVLDGVSFDINKGDFFGIVGRNGSGKSTLLKLIAGVYTPNRGSIEVVGSLTPFIELGVGFNFELSGRDNVYLNGALLGFTRSQIDEMYDEIVEFAELEPFMGQKLKNYSSGMQVRLAFSIAIRAKADILVLDEVLAVGDEAFQRKCSDYFNDIKNDRSQTVVLVTHSMEAVKKYCNRAVLIKEGKVVAIGDPLDVANEYTLENLEEAHVEVGESMSKDEVRNGVENIKIKLLSDRKIDHNGSIKIMMEYDVVKDITTVPHISLVDVDRYTWIQNDNMWENVIKGKGHKKVIYESTVPELMGNSVLKIQAGVRSGKDEILGFIDDRYSPRIIVQRKDLKSRHKTGLATGVIFKSGNWEVL